LSGFIWPLILQFLTIRLNMSISIAKIGKL